MRGRKISMTILNRDYRSTMVDIFEFLNGVNYGYSAF